MTNLGGLRWILMVYDGLRWFSGVSGKVILYITFEENYNHSYIRTYIHILYIYIWFVYEYTRWCSGVRGLPRCSNDLTRSRAQRSVSRLVWISCLDPVPRPTLQLPWWCAWCWAATCATCAMKCYEFHGIYRFWTCGGSSHGVTGDPWRSHYWVMPQGCDMLWHIM